MATTLAALGIGGVWLALMSYGGLGLAWLLAPAALRRGWWLLAPQFGYCLAALVGYYLTQSGFTLRAAVWVVVLLASVCNSVALVIWRRRRFAVVPPTHDPLAPRGWLVPGLLGVTMLAWWLNIWPVLSYGQLMPIGHNWDVEFYLPLAAYLRDYSYAALPSAPPNPLLPVVTALPTSARAIGFAYAQGMTDLLRGGQSFESFAPLLALLRALSVPALYLLARVGFGLRPFAALAGALLVSLNGLLLWITYNSFAMQVAATPLLPLLLLVTILALRDQGWRAPLAAGLVLAGMTLSYYPMLLPYAVFALPLGLVALARAWRRAGTSGALGLCLRAGGLLAVGVGLSLLAHLRARQAFLDTFAERTPSMGIDSFVGLAGVLGSAPFSHRPLLLDAPLPVVVSVVGLVAVVLLVALGLWQQGWRRAEAAALFVACVLYWVWLRYGVAFPYGFMKGMSYASFVPLLLACAALQSRPKNQKTRKPAAQQLGLFVAAPLFVVAAATMAWAAFDTARVYVGRPGIYSLDDVQARALPAHLAAPGAVLIDHSTALRGPYVGLLGYSLLHRELIGKNDAGFGRINHLPPGVAPAYGVFAAADDPAAWGFDRSAAVWNGGRARSYAAPAERVAHLQGRIGAYDEPTLGASGDDGSLSVSRLGIGDYYAALPERPLPLYRSSDALAFAPLPPAPSVEPRALKLALVSFQAQDVLLRAADYEARYRLNVGLNYVVGEPLTQPEMTLVPTAGPVFLRWAELYAPPITPGVTRDENVLAYRVEGTVEGNLARVRVLFANGSNQALRAGLEFFQNTRTAPAHPASGLFQAPTAEAVELLIDPQARTALINGAPLPVQQHGPAPDGSYFVSLWMYAGEEGRARVPLLSYRWQNGAASELELLTPAIGFAWAQPPATALDATFGEVIRLEGYSLDQKSYAPGTTARLSLHWRSAAPVATPYLLFAQLLDANQGKVAQWDGNVGGDWLPAPAWQVGQGVRQDVPLSIVSDAPPGRYQLIVGLYDPATGQRLPVSLAGQPNGDFVALDALEIE